MTTPYDSTSKGGNTNLRTVSTYDPYVHNLDPDRKQSDIHVKEAQYAPISNNKPSVVYDPPVMNETKKVTLPAVNMDKYNPNSVGIPRIEATEYRDGGGYHVGMGQYYKDIARNRSKNINFGFRLPKLKRNRKRIYIA